MPPDELGGSGLGVVLVGLGALVVLVVVLDAPVKLVMEVTLDAVELGVGVELELVTVPVSTASPNLVAMIDACRLSMLQQSLSPPQHHRVEFAGFSVSHGVTWAKKLADPPADPP
jgi:hypothetical protein